MKEVSLLREKNDIICRKIFKNALTPESDLFMIHAYIGKAKRKRSTSETVIQESGQRMGIPYDGRKGKTLPSPTRTARVLSREGVKAARYPRMGLLEPLRSKSGGTTERQPSS